MALCYNFTRVLNIFGFERFVAYMAAKALALCEHAPAVALHAVQLVLAAFWALILGLRLEISRLGCVLAS